jgi:hypothetical protein
MLSVLFFGIIVFIWEAWIWEIVDLISLIGSFFMGILLAFVCAK